MLRLAMAVVALLSAMPAMAQDAAVSDDGTVEYGTRISTDPSYQIRHGMEASADGWNKGDVDSFLAIYSDDPATSFTGSSGIARGKAGIRARYLEHYTKQFGKGVVPATALTFAFEDLRMIGPDHALLIARWMLTTKDGSEKPQTGMTSLIFRKEAGGWKIVADHSS